MLGLQDITRRTYATGAWSGGEFTAGSAADTTIRGALRPMPERDVELLPSGDRTRDPRVLYTRTACTIVAQGQGQQSDRVSADGSTWYELVKDYDGDPPSGTPAIRHHRYAALRIQEAG
jgi:hypothetical protein